MKTRLPLFAAILALPSTGLAQPPERIEQIKTPDKNSPPSPSTGVSRPELLLSAARKIRSDKGCAAALPTFRVIASFGKGHEVAQSELGACLLEVAEGEGEESALFRDEGLLWLRRAAWGGEARAQWTLANILSGAPGAREAGVGAAPKEALGWALVYENNAAHKLYGLDPVDPNVVAHLHGALTPEASADAETFAAEFTPIAMATFTPPARQNAKRRGRSDGRPSGGQRRRRPR